MRALSCRQAGKGRNGTETLVRVVLGAAFGGSHGIDAARQFGSHGASGDSVNRV